MKYKGLDPAWTAWLKENLDRRCDPNELVAILRKKGFALRVIKESMGDKFPNVDMTRTESSERADSGTSRRLDDSWKAWLKENIDRRCDPQQLLDILFKNGFSMDSIATHLIEHYPAAAQILDGVPPQESLVESDYKAIAEPSLVRRQASSTLTRVAMDKLQLYLLDDFLNDAECDALIGLIGRHLRPSTITVEVNDKYFRTSSTCDLSALHDPIVTAIDEKIAKTLGIRMEYSEGNQAQRYEVGQQFKAHTDYFEPGTTEYIEHATTAGNRTWTFMVYLNDGMQGGGTRFHSIDRTILPKKGQAVIWNNLYPNGAPNPDTLHSGEPVLGGHKIIITKWFREKGTGPMFYDE